MNVRTWVDLNKNKYPFKNIRMMDYETKKGLGVHWIVYTDFEVKKAKITSQYIFLYV